VSHVAPMHALNRPKPTLAVERRAERIDQDRRRGAVGLPHVERDDAPRERGRQQVDVRPLRFVESDAP